MTEAPALPSGTVTFLFTDLESATKLVHELGAEAYAGALAEQRRPLREAFTAHGGVEVNVPVERTARRPAQASVFAASSGSPAAAG